jgi:hypothetical protein
MPTRFRPFVFAATLASLLALAAPGSFAQAQGFARQQPPRRVPPPPVSFAGYHPVNDGLRSSNLGPYSTPDPLFANGQTRAELADFARQRDAISSQAAFDGYGDRQRQQAEAAQKAMQRQREVTQVRADPGAPDQSELLKNSHDRDFILHNFQTMYVEAYDARYFGSDQMKGALGRNKEFEKLHIRIVDDPRVADVVLRVSYTFAWDYPFELRHQNTTFVLLSGKGEGPFSGPLGAADVARQFVNAAKPWREVKRADGKEEAGNRK